MDPLVVLFGLVGLALGAYALRGRVRFVVGGSSSAARRSTLRVLVTDGRTAVTAEAERTEAGTIRVGRAEYPMSLLMPVDDTCGAGVRYMLAVEGLALVRHQQLEQHRAAVVKGAMFQSGGDLMHTLRICAAAAVIGAAVFQFWVTQSLGAAIARQEAVLTDIREWTEAPLVVLPSGGEE